MKYFLHLIVLVLLVSLGSSIALSQVNAPAVQTAASQVPQTLIPSQYIFFSADTLQGMDLNSLFNDLGRYNARSHLDEREKRAYMYSRQHEFVRTKFHLPGPAFLDPALFINSGTDRKHPAANGKAMRLGNPTAAQNSIIGKGPLFRQGQGSNPSALAANTCNDNDFETDLTNGTAAPTNWSVDIIYANPNNLQGVREKIGFKGKKDAKISNAIANNVNNDCSFHTLVSTGTDPYGNTPMVYPGSGTQSYRLGGPYVNLGGAGGPGFVFDNVCGYGYSGALEMDSSTGPGAGIHENASAGELIWQNITVSASNALLTYFYDVYLADGGHPANEQPYFNAWIIDASDNIIPCSNYVQECTSGSPPFGRGYSTSGTAWGPFPEPPGTAQAVTNVYYSGWQSNTFDLTPYIGTTVQLQFMTAGCFPGGHFGYAYVDGFCGPKALTVGPPVCSGNMTVSGPPMPPGTSYHWTGPGIVSGSSTGTITVNKSGTYQITITPPSPNNLCPITISSVVTFISGPSLSPSTLTNISCNGGANNGSATANVSAGTGTPGYTYSWAWSTGSATTQTISNLGVNTYTVTVTDANSCTSTSTVAITQPAPVTATANPTNATCGKTNGQVTANPAGGNGGFTYTWNTGSGSNSITGLPPSPPGYTVTVTDSKGCSKTATANVGNTAGPVASVSAFGNVNCFGGNTGTATASGAGGTGILGYAWNPGFILGASVTGLSANVIYTVTVTDANLCTSTSTVTLTQPSSALSASTGSTSSLCGSKSGSVSVNASGGTPGYTYSWNTNATAQTVTNLAAGSYTVTVTDLNGCSKILTQAVNNATGGAAVSISSSTNTLCNGSSTGSATVTISGGAPPLNWTFSSGTGGTVAGTGFTSTITGLAAGPYTLLVTDADGCLTSSATILTSPSAVTPSVSFQSNATCFDSTNGQATITSTGGTGGFSYSWSGGAGNFATATNLVPGTLYTVQVTDANSCTATISVSISQPTAISIATSSDSAVCGSANGSVFASPTGGTPGYQYSWSPGGAVSPTAAGLIAGTYSVTVTDKNGCTSTTTQGISNAGAANVVLSSSVATLCIGQADTLKANVSGGSPGYSYSWSIDSTSAGPFVVSPVTTTTYSLTVTDSKGCTSAVQTVQVKVNPPLNVTLTSSGKTICNGASATLTATATGGNTNYSFTWLPSGTTGPTLAITPGTNTTYTVTLNDNCGTPQATASVPITVDVPPTVIISSDGSIGCSDHPVCIQFSGSSNPPGACVSTEWYFGDSDSSSQANPKHCYTAAGVYTVSMKCTDASGCSSISAPGSNTITVIQNPKAAFSYTPASVIIQDTTIAFTSHSTGASSLLWNFGDTASQANNTSILINPTHAYKDSGNYCILLVAFNTGCVDTARQCLIVHEACTLPKQIPNVFSPNGDGINDIFTIRSSGLKELICTMYNRWGMEIYQYDAVLTGWDGHTFSDSKAPDGTYYYILKATCLTSTDQLKGNGFLQLVR